MSANLNYADVERAAKEQMFGMGNSGFCLECGEEQDGCEPDAHGYECECCGEFAVMGACEVLMTQLV